MPKLAYTITEAAEATGVNARRIRRAIRAAELRAKWSGTKVSGPGAGVDGAGKLLIQHAELARWVDGLVDA